jgi:hypothetical protein
VNLAKAKFGPKSQPIPASSPTTASTPIAVAPFSTNEPSPAESQELSLDSPELDAVILSSYLALLRARDERVRLGATHDLADIRKKFVKPLASAPGTNVNILATQPDVLKGLLSGLRELVQMP